jgi:2,4-dienoyl-CoA reductase-like NADH-dependent reductase (Old Yellow Enzyme family)/NADPH-dependent 2,4-dienoyl-CoA reductase/sulfur reductase-like enzyme
MNQFPHVFSPFNFGNVGVKNRIATPPMLACMATTDGFVTREMIEFYQSFARGGAGIVTIGDSAVDFDYARGHFGQLNLGDDAIIGGLSTLVEAVQKYGAKISIELDHSGRLSPPKVIGGRNPIGPSPIPTKGEEMAARAEGREVVQVTEMDQDLIDRVVENFANASYRCLTAGFEMVMVHGGHGQLLSQFVSPLANKRTDKYGGSLKNRARFVIEVLTAIRRKVGDRLALEYRVSADELVPGGMHEEETIEFLKMIEDQIDLINVSVGGMIAEPKYIAHMAQPTYFPHAFNLPRAEKIKKNVRVPVTCVGSIMDLATADTIIAEGKADMVAMGRAHIADPEIVNKTYYGKTDEVRPCVRCNVCGERPKDFFPVRCAVNPVIGREAEYRHLRPAENKKKIVVVGGGPAGMESTIIAASRGHQVTLFEKEKELGGALRMATVPEFKADMKRYLEWMIRKTFQAPVQVKLSTEATAGTIKAMTPNALILAVGAEPVIPDIAGINKPNVVWAGEADREDAFTGKTIVVAGAGLTGCETALHLVGQGKKVTIIDMIGESEIAKDMTLVSRIALLELLQQQGVAFEMGVELKEITDKGVVVNKNGNRLEIQADSVVLSLGVKPRSEAVRMLQGLVREVYVIGDCLTPRNLMAAIHDAFTVAAEI